ncbi:uncharacterized protein LOC120077306 [Benincasa hispida]|uniref:uncharacterized protein LOC120077306 n=1 Tax=Benincasa hispida TaxID=102211 RepID=UPI001902080E|nr:uncharacterized protein LOC120077306 [Benincasa hispida]
MKDIMKKEITKWLDVGVIYPISDSQWVSHVQCVPKKWGMIVVTNNENEQIPTRTVTSTEVVVRGWPMELVARMLPVWGEGRFPEVGRWWSELTINNWRLANDGHQGGSQSWPVAVAKVAAEVGQ